MNLPETCPFCGSGSEIRNAEKWVGFTCITTIHQGQDARRLQSATCAGLERTRLLARVAELERDLEQAKADRNRAAMDARNPMMARVAELEARCRRLEEAGDAVLGGVPASFKGAWRAAKEAKP